MNLEIGSSPPLPPSQEQDPLTSVGPLPPHLLPPPDPAAGELWRLVFKEIAPWTGPECN